MNRISTFEQIKTLDLYAVSNNLWTGGTTCN